MHRKQIALERKIASFAMDCNQIPAIEMATESEYPEFELRLETLLSRHRI